MPVLALFLSAYFCLAQFAWADVSEQQVDDLKDQVQQLRQTVEDLNRTVKAQALRISELENNRPQAVAATIPPPMPPSAGSTTQTASQTAFNPEIGAVADIVAQSSESSANGDGNDALTVREMELVLGHPIDPYSRLDATIAFSELENVDLEEAYITHWGLPAEIKGRIGKFLPKIGKGAALHRDSLDTVDEPLVVSRYFGPEGFFRSGIELTGFLPMPWDTLTHELTAGILEGGVADEGTLLGQSRRYPTPYVHLKNFWDISDTSNVELGGTYLMGSSDNDSDYEVKALGLDLTLTHYVTPSNKLKWQSEAYFQNRDESVTVGVTGTTSVPNSPWGFYSLLDYRLSPRFGLGTRLDYVEPIGLDPAVRARHGDTAWSGYLTFYQSEFARWRAQYRHTNFAAGGDDNAVFLQGTVAIGVHKHQLQ